MTAKQARSSFLTRHVASLKTKSRTIAVKAVPTPDHVAYVADKSALFKEKLKNIKELRFRQ